MGIILIGCAALYYLYIRYFKKYFFKQNDINDNSNNKNFTEADYKVIDNKKNNKQN